MTRDTVSDRGPLVMGCVTEPVPKYLQQAARLLLSIRWFAGRVANTPFILCTTGKLPAAAESFFIAHGAEIVAVERFSDKHGPSNKIRFLELPLLDDWQHILLLDCDTVLTQDPAAYLSYPGLAAKVADAPTVTTDEFEQLFSRFNLDMPSEKYRHDIVDKPCIAYFNSGVIVLNSVWRECFVTAWNHYNRAILEKWHSLSMKPFYSDQASLALAIQSTGIPVTPLPTRMNLGCHWPAYGYPQHFSTIDPIIIHYHGLFDENGYISRTPLEQTNRRIAVFNARLRAEKIASDAMRHIPGTVLDRSATPRRPKVLIGSGWWCADKDSPGSTETAPATTMAFFYLWYTQIVKCLSPSAIVITDRQSPLKPDYQAFELIHWIELEGNNGHANGSGTGKVEIHYSHFTQSILSGCMYALNSDADYYVYVEQGCLLKGDNFLNVAIGETSEDILSDAPASNDTAGNANPDTVVRQPSLIIVKRSGMERFISGFLNAVRNEQLSAGICLQQQLQPLGRIQAPYAQSRPSDFSRPHVYARHLSQEELDTFIDAADLSDLRDNVMLKPFYELL